MGEQDQFSPDQMSKWPDEAGQWHYRDGQDEWVMDSSSVNQAPPTDPTKYQQYLDQMHNYGPGDSANFRQFTNRDHMHYVWGLGSAWARECENRKRTAAGQPTVEEEEAAQRKTQRNSGSQPESAPRSNGGCGPIGTMAVCALVALLVGLVIIMAPATSGLF